MRENPVQGLEAPVDKNPRRPVASHDRYEAIRAVADQVSPDFADLFDLAAETGRRISAVCQLRYSDLRLNDRSTPYGAILWPADTDKQGKEWPAPLSEIARTALDRLLSRRPGIGTAYLFPHTQRVGKPISRWIAAGWLKKAEEIAGLQPLKGSQWRAYRRKWASERKHLSDVDVAKAGGWKSTVTLKTIYQQADMETMVTVVNNARRLREAT